MTPKLLRPLAFLIAFAWVVWLFWTKPQTQQAFSSTGTEPCRHVACRQLERQQFGRAKRTYVKGSPTESNTVTLAGRIPGRSSGRSLNARVPRLLANIVHCVLCLPYVPRRFCFESLQG